MRHIIPISGKDSLWTAIVQQRRMPELDYEYLFNDTGQELPETYQWLSDVETSLKLSITHVGRDLEDVMYDQGILPSPMARYCTRMSKIYPMEDYIGKEPAYIYYGIRADENRPGYNNAKRPNIVPKYPLVEENQTIHDVYAGLHALNLLPPAFEWRSLIQKTKELLGEDASLIDKLHPLTHRQLFAWRSRTNCYFCFYQRRYEWIGLAEHHPDLFEKACQLEENIGAAGYTWIRGIPLRDYVKRKDKIIEKRARSITKFLKENEELIDDEGPVDLLKLTSCGIFCGK